MDLSLQSQAAELSLKKSLLVSLIYHLGNHLGGEKNILWCKGFLLGWLELSTLNQILTLCSCRNLFFFWYGKLMEIASTIREYKTKKLKAFWKGFDCISKGEKMRWRAKILQKPGRPRIHLNIIAESDKWAVNSCKVVLLLHVREKYKKATLIDPGHSARKCIAYGQIQEPWNDRLWHRSPRNTLLNFTGQDTSQVDKKSCLCVWRLIIFHIHLPVLAALP